MCWLLRIVADATPRDDPTLSCDAIRVRFPVESDAMWAVVTGSPLKYPHNDDHSVEARINLVNLGDAQILTVPGEALPVEEDVAVTHRGGAAGGRRRRRPWPSRP